MNTQRFEMLLGLYGDEPMTRIFSEQETIRSWLRVEVALAAAQADLGVVEPADAQAIAAAAKLDTIDRDRLWNETRTVGYPILSLVRQIDAALPHAHRGRVHYGATTQDIMDSGLAVQLDAAAQRLGVLLGEFGDALARLAQAHAGTVIAGRTHAMQAVPSTLGAKLATYLAELARHRDRLAAARTRAAVVSLFGAAGTSAAYGEHATGLRAAVARRLGLSTTEVAWHVARDGLAEFGAVCALLAGTCARFAREVVDLSRTEIGEVAEAAGHHRGASSTMPQKANPIESEAVIGAAITAGALSSALFRIMEAGHERAAGEWQAEWQVLPQLVCLGAAALRTATSIATGLQVFPTAMRANLNADGGLVLAEAYMMNLAPRIGREQAHDIVYLAAARCRSTGQALHSAIRAELPADIADTVEELTPDSYLGQPYQAVEAALGLWHTRP
ncbi:3-carboxy-cis,cis-muconate cycloisomerase [Nocardia sp. GAS34]|uniref:class-II fumarase/aspartase family protein n=1 Tax=unclassified Nocardia TaxID=2637762 RepID=UPI003D1D96BF